MSSPSSIEVIESPRRFPSSYPDGVQVRPSHHLNDNRTKFTNPWPSFRYQTFFQLVSFVFKLILRAPSLPRNVKSLIPHQTPTWGTEPGNENNAKATWLGHACYLVELPTPPGAVRGVRIIFDPVFSNRGSPFRWGSPRYTDPPCKIEEVPAVDAIILSHNHYDHTDISTLRALLAKPSSSPHVIAPLNNVTYLSRGLSTPPTRFHELDWWDERLLRVALPTSSADGPSVNAEVRLTCTPSQHMSGRSLTDRFHALWASWVVDDHLSSHKKFYFTGDTGYRTVRDGEDEDKAPVCPVYSLRLR